MTTLSAELFALIAAAFAGFLGGRVSAARARRPAAIVPPSPVRRDEGLDRLLIALPVAAITVDELGYVTFMNAAASALYRVDSARAVGRALIEAVPSVRIEVLMRQALSGVGASSVVTYPRVDDEATIRIAAYPLSSEGGNGAVVIGEDQTKVAGLERVRRDFISDVSHELRTPLSAIKLMVETIGLSGNEPAVVSMFLPKVEKELDRIAHLVQDLLDVAQTESGRVQLRVERVDLRALARGALETFRPRANALGVSLLCDEEPGSCDADVDPQRYTQILVNLIDNALRHTASGGHIRVAVACEGREAVLSVADDGVGIPYHDLPHIFERFYVVERSRARESGGTGLGLAIVYQIVEAHGGSIVAESELGTGSTFICRLPLRVS